jgi:hypothetical protein
LPALYGIRRLVAGGDKVAGLIHEAGRGKTSGAETERLMAVVYTLDIA